MPENFREMGDGRVLVRSDKGFVPLVIPEGFTEHEFRIAIASVATYWRIHSKLPSMTEVAKSTSALTAKRFGEISMTKEFIAGCQYRGVEWEERDGLSLEQQSVLLMLQDYTDRRAIGTKLREMAVPVSRYQNWLKNPLFRKAVNDNAESVLAEAVAPALTALAGNAAAGNTRDIEILLAMTGRWNPAQMQLEDARAVVLSMVEAIIKHVPDVTVREAIMADVSMTAATLAAIDR